VVEAECRVDQQRVALLLLVDRFLQRQLHAHSRRVVGCMLPVALQLANTCCTVVDAHTPAASNGGTGPVAPKIGSAESQNQFIGRKRCAALPTVRAVTRLPRAERDGIGMGRTGPRDTTQTNKRPADTYAWVLTSRPTRVGNDTTGYWRCCEVLGYMLSTKEC
jgi:hypothetical protein